MLKPAYTIPDLPPPVDLETKAVLKALAVAHRHLAELKGKAAIIPNPGILVDTLSLQEAKASSEIENIVTTQDQLFQLNLFSEGPQSTAAKEVARYRDALRIGHTNMRDNQNFLTNNLIIDMFRVLKGHGGGFRQTPGTALLNDLTGNIVYVPPQDALAIQTHMNALEHFINGPDQSPIDPLIRMALIHHQFESIHPFPDGNGRLGRILNVLYLVKVGLLDSPILYLSRYITVNKGAYYRELQAVRESGNWEPWLLYMLEAVTQTSQQTIELVEGIKGLMTEYKQRLRTSHPKLYSQDLLNNLFRHPYTRIEYVASDLNVSRQTAAKYLEQLSLTGLLIRQQSGRNIYYINHPLVELFARVSP